METDSAVLDRYNLINGIKDNISVQTEVMHIQDLMSVTSLDLNYGKTTVYA